MQSTNQIRILIVDDHLTFARSIQSELEKIKSDKYPFKIVSIATHVEEAIAKAEEYLPDVILLDVHLPGGSGGGGAEVAAAITDLTSAQDQPIRALALSVSDAEEDVIAVIRAGARGYVTKSSSEVELAEAIVKVASGDAVFSPRLAGFVLDAFRGDAPQMPSEMDLLSPREQQVMKYIARGHTYRETASALYISDRTVETHVSNVLKKLQLSNRYELSRWARDKKVI